MKNDTMYMSHFNLYISTENHRMVEVVTICFDVFFQGCIKFVNNTYIDYLP